MKNNEMRTVLITGASGNVGLAVLNYLDKIDSGLQVFAGVHDMAADSDRITAFNVTKRHFDFADISSIEASLIDIDTLFLLRPPQLADVKKYFHPVIQTAKEKGVEHIVFLSVQGAEKSALIPHHKIEKLIIQSGINYTFLRPAYFMQNFSTTLLKEIKEHNTIYLPAGSAKFAVVDVEDIGNVVARIITSPSEHINKGYDLTNDELLNFKEMASILSLNFGREIGYVSPNLISFYINKRKKNVPSMYILVMIMLHYLPRFQKTPALSTWVEKLTNKKPTTFSEFVVNNKHLF